MKTFLTLALLLLGLLTTAHAQDADSKYIHIYALIEQGEKLASSGQPRDAVASFTDAQTQLLQFRRVYPDWNPAIINFRLKMLAEKIAELKPLVPALAPLLPKTAVPAVVAAPSAPAEPSPQVQQLNEQLQSVQAENATLQAKLKEALSSQPAVVEASELTKAQEQLRSLMKENDLLKASQSVAEEKIVTKVVTDTNAVAQAEKLAAENQQLKTSVDRRAEELTQAKKELDDYIKKNAAEQARALQLAAENEVLNRRLKESATGGDAVTVLREENARLKNQIEALRAVGANAPDVVKLTADLLAAQKQITVLKGAVATITQERDNLTIELRALKGPAKSETGKAEPKAELAKAAPQADVAGYEVRLRTLSDERDNLQRKLDDANRKLAKRKTKDTDAEIAQLRQEVDSLRARLAVTEAKAIPYTTEELALFRQAAPQVPATSKTSIKEMPAGTAELVASAQQHFAKRELPQAEADYQKILERDQNNVIALANLATIELQQGKVEDAEKHLQTALAKSPNDAYSLATLGYLKFLQQKYNEAFDILSRANQLDPNNPETLNYLGVTLSHKGLRKDAESALRLAISLNPNYAPAHNNLAVIYLTAESSAPQLARFHYQKALAAGQPRNPDLEKALADKGAPVDVP